MILKISSHKSNSLFNSTFIGILGSAMVVIFSFSAPLSAQPFVEVGSLYFTRKASPGWSSPETHSNPDENQISAGFTLPVKVGKDNFLVFSPGYDRHTYQWDQTELAPDVYTLYFPLSYLYQFRDTAQRISFTGVYRFNAEIGFSPSGNNDQLGFAVVYSRQVSQRLALKGGLFYNKEFFGNWWLPLIGFDYAAGPRLNIWGILPRNATADYEINRFLHTGISYKGFQESYRIGDTESTWFSTREGQIRAYVDFYPFRSNLAIILEAGHTLFREMETGTGDLESGNDLRSGDGMVFRAGLAWRHITDQRYAIRRSR